jgi:tetratricopeptide (TPR) repeat protein
LFKFTKAFKNYLPVSCDCPAPKSFQDKLKGKYTIWVCLILTCMIFFSYMQVVKYEFTNFDDDNYVYANPRVTSGLTAKNIVWAFSSAHCANWHPITWISHMLDVEIYGINAGGHHFTNLIFHVANTILLFVFLKGVTGSFWSSALVAALFALHPLHVESVAWISERKDVLSTFFALLTLICYGWYGIYRISVWYLSALLFFILGLMTKPMLVTLPCLFLLLDYWPLSRIDIKNGFEYNSSREFSSISSLLWEKIPFFMLAASSIVITYYVQQSAGAVSTYQFLPLGERILNALVSYAAYIGKMFWPAGLSVFYPYPDSLELWKASFSLALLTGITLFTIWQRKRRPYLLVGWLWYFGMLVPVIGIVQVGGQAMADRYMYMPIIGLFIMISWAGSDIMKRKLLKPIFAVFLVTLVLLILMETSRRQTRHWVNSITLYNHALAVTNNNETVHLNLGKALNDAGKNFEARRHYEEALRINPDFADAHLNLGSSLLDEGQIRQAINYYNHALRLKPDMAAAYNNIGLALVRTGNLEKAITFFRIALEKDPENAEATINLKLSKNIMNKIFETVRSMRKILSAENANSLSLDLAKLSKRKKEMMETVDYYRDSLTKQPGFSGLSESDIPILLEVMLEYECLLPIMLKIIDNQPENGEACYHIACIYARKGQSRKADLWLKRAINAAPTKRIFFESDPDMMNLKK